MVVRLVPEAKMNRRRASSLVLQYAASYLTTNRLLRKDGSCQTIVILEVNECRAASLDGINKKYRYMGGLKDGGLAHWVKAGLHASPCADIGP
ncbi:hypothetical protein CGGC5_v017131 [Colletotrichum fructicola Nara gc5]|uniref:Uncharacterized protein n=1 Tax=Colletotrichum fructicola (strain Nara gc5) TaxID=1213859 RepID=A0A7J6IF97_COLFN|nr:hypothetical protein CFRS1_v012465 [Colletotrichum fructicola]KAF4474516.1 hypothetical protein CGGC5_v017131 [Colletotrichum fructicola Nara gc5]